MQLDVQKDLSYLRTSDFGLYISKGAIPLYRFISGPISGDSQIPCELTAGLQELLDFFFPVAYGRELSVL